MNNSEITLQEIVQNRGSKTRMVKSSTNKVREWSEKWPAIKGFLPKNWPTMKEFVDPKGPYIRKWNIVFKPMTYSRSDSVFEEHKPLEMTFVVVNGKAESVNDYYEAGDFYGLELVHWITNWASHDCIPAKLPLSRNSVWARNELEVLVLWSDDLKRIVSKFRSDFMKQTTLPIDSEGKLATLDPFTMLKKVPILENADEEILAAICSHLKPMKYSDDTPGWPFIIRMNPVIDKMFFIGKGLVCFIKEGKRSYHYSGNYFAEQLIVGEWKMWNTSCFWVGKVEILVLTIEDLAKMVSEFRTAGVWDLFMKSVWVLNSDSKNPDTIYLRTQVGILMNSGSEPVPDPGFTGTEDASTKFLLQLQTTLD